MKIKNIFNLLMISAVALMTFSCTEKAPEYEPGTSDVKECYDVYFPEQQTDFVLNKLSPKEIVITVARKVTSGAITVPFTLFEETNTMTASEIKFADGQGETTCTLTFDKAKFDVNYHATLAINDYKYASKYNLYAVYQTNIIIENYNFIDKVQYLDGFLYVIGTDTREDLKIQEVELYKKEDTQIFRIVDPFANTKAIEDAWYGPGSTNDERSKKWEFEMLEDGHLKYDDIIYTGLLYQEDQKKYAVVYEMPSKVGQSGDNKIKYDDYAKLFMLEPIPFVPDLGGGFLQTSVWVGANADVDIAALLGL